jgi:hypothetical protein
MHIVYDGLGTPAKLFDPRILLMFLMKKLVFGEK